MCVSFGMLLYCCFVVVVVLYQCCIYFRFMSSWRKAFFLVIYQSAVAVLDTDWCSIISNDDDATTIHTHIYIYKQKSIYIYNIDLYI